MIRIRALLLCAALCFCTALLACFVQFSCSWGRGETNLALVFDSGHYQETARQIVSALDHGGRPERVGADAGKQQETLAQALMLDGPVLPGLAALTFLSFGRLLALSDWQCLLCLQAFLHASGAALVFLLARHIFAPAFKWALVAGLVWAVNPIAVLSTQRFLSENLACDLLLLLVLLLLLLTYRSGLKLFFLSLAAGSAAALILFSKTGLAPAAALVLLVAAVVIFKSGPQANADGSGRSPGRNLALLVAGLALGTVCIIFPWAMYTKGASGEAQYFPQRAPALNLLVGWNFENDGLSTLPIAPVYGPLQALYNETKSAPQAVLRLWLQAPGPSLLLAGRKVARLYGLPWNDFRRASLFFSPKMQQVLHQAMLFLALFATCLALCRGAPLAGWLSLSIIAGHFIFLLFESVPRYAFSSYPFIWLLALYFIQSLVNSKWSGRQLVLCGGAGLVLLVAVNISMPGAWFEMFEPLLPEQSFAYYALLQGLIVLAVFLILARLLPLGLDEVNKLRFGMALVLSASLYLTLLLCQALHASSRAEWEHKLTAGQSCRRTFLMQERGEKPAFALLLIDGARQIGASEISVNGFVLPGKAVNFFDYFPDRKAHYLFAQQVAAFMGRSESDIRRWWAVPVPIAALKYGGDNTIALSVPANASVRLFGEYDSLEASQIWRPGFLYFSPGKIWTSNDSFEWREGRPFSTRRLSGKSFGADGQPIKESGNWRMILCTGPEGRLESLFEAGRVNVY